jgi:hypothetical protein
MGSLKRRESGFGANANSHLSSVGAYIQLSASWKFREGEYRELEKLGVEEGGEVSFSSFTSEGKRSQGRLVDVTDIHPKSLGFEALMPAGPARMAYWPDEAAGVEAKTKKGWKRFAQHHYTPE